MLRRCFIPTLVAFGLLSFAHSAVSQERVLGVVPQGAPIALASQWQPVITQLQKSLSQPFQFSTAPTITRFEQRVLNGDYDYVYMNPLLYLRAQKKAGYRALVRRKNPLRGILVTARDRPTNLKALRGSVIAFPSPTALGATVLTRAELKRRRINHRVSYVGTHTSGYQAVVIGRYPAAGGVRRSFDLLPESTRQKLKIILETRPINGHVIAVHPRIPATEANRVKQQLLSLHTNADTLSLLQGLKVERFVTARSTDFDAIKTLSLPPLRKLTRIVLHVIPRLDEASTRNQMNPLISFVQQQLELELELRTYPSMGSFDKAILSEKRPALINANPLQAIKLSKKGYRIIAQQVPVSSPKGMHSVILVARNSPYKKLSDLRNKRIAFGGNRNAFFASIVPRVMLGRAGLHGKYTDASKPGPVSDVIKRLYKGKIDAAGTGAMATNSKLLMDRYQIHEMPVLAYSEPMPGLAWLVSRNIPRDIAAELRDLLLNFGPSAPGHSSMTSAGIAGMRPASLKTYEPVKKYIEEATHLK